MKKVYISKNYRNPYTASSKAKLDVEEIIKSVGFKNIGLPCRNFASTALGRTWTYVSIKLGISRLPYKGYVILQHPTYKIENLVKKAKNQHNTIIIIIHDINYLRNTGNEEELNYLKDVSYVIVHSEPMKRYIETHFPGPKVVVLGIFDYLNSNLTHYKHGDEYQIAFAGNLEKSEFIHNLPKIPIKFNLYGIGGDKIPHADNISYKGLFHPSKLGENIEGDFGLVWDGNDVGNCTGSLGEYLKVISPHKLSMYLSAGIPVIVWKEAAVAHFVEERNVGISINTLEELPDIINKISREQYFHMKEMSLKIASLLKNGYFLKTAVSKCLEDKNHIAIDSYD